MAWSRYHASAIAIVLLAPAFAAPGASAEPCADCPPLTLYVQSDTRGLSSLPGTGAPGHSTSFAEGARPFVASVRLPQALELRAGEILVSLPGRSAHFAGDHETRVRVLAGADVLAEGVFRSAQPGPAAQEQMRAAATGAEAAGDRVGLAGRDAIGLVGSPDVGRSALAAANATWCTRSVGGFPLPDLGGAFSSACGTYRGDWQLLNLRFCSGTTSSGGPLPLVGSGLTPAVLRGEAPVLPRVAPPPPLTTNPTVQQLGSSVGEATIGPLNGLLVDPVNERIADAYPAHATPDLCGEAAPKAVAEGQAAPLADEALPGGAAAMGDAASDAADDARAGAHDALPIDGDAGWSTFTLPVQARTLPAGAGLVLEVALLRAPVAAGTGTASTIPYGREDARASFTLPTADATAFRAFATSAERVGPGRHTGHFSRPADRDDLAFAPPTGDVVVLQTRGAALQVWTPSGRPVSSPFLAREPGEHVVRLAPTSGRALPTDGEYVLTIGFETPPSSQDDAGSGRDANASAPVALPGSGTWFAYSGQADREDVFAFRVDQGQPFRLDLVGEGVAFANGAETTLHGAPFRSTTLHVSVTRGAGAGPYALVLWLDPDAALANATPFERVGTLKERPVLALAYVDGEAVPFSYDGAWRRDANGTYAFLPGAGAVGRAVQLADGSVWGGHPFARTIDAVGAPGARARGAFGYFDIAPTGGIVSVLPEGPAPSWSPAHRLVANDGGEERTLADGIWPGAVAVAPDGGVFVLQKGDLATLRDGALATVLTDALSFTDVTPTASGELLLSTFDGRVVGYDPASRARRTVAYAPTLSWGGLAVGEERIAIVGASSSWGVYEAAVPGVAPRALPAPAGPQSDLVVRDVQVVHVPEADVPGGPSVFRREVRVTAANLGEADAPATTLLLRSECVACDAFVRQRVEGQATLPALSPGEETVVVFPWSTAGHAGRWIIEAHADTRVPTPWLRAPLGGDALEADEGNNHRHRTYLIGAELPVAGQV